MSWSDKHLGISGICELIIILIIIYYYICKGKWQSSRGVSSFRSIGLWSYPPSFNWTASFIINLWKIMNGGSQCFQWNWTLLHSDLYINAVKLLQLQLGSTKTVEYLDLSTYNLKGTVTCLWLYVIRLKLESSNLGIIKNQTNSGGDTSTVGPKAVRVIILYRISGTESCPHQVQTKAVLSYIQVVREVIFTVGPNAVHFNHMRIIHTW